MHRPIFLALMLGVMLAGCQTITPEERQARDEAECRSYGFKQRNDAFAACMQRLEMDRRETRREALRYDPWVSPRFVVYR